MAHYRYLILGGGMTAAAAVQGIREVDPQGSIGILSAESHRPYNRPPLTKKLWQGKAIDTIWRNFPQENLDLILGRRIITLDPQNKRLEDESGRTYEYDRLLLATGGDPRRLPFEIDGILYYRTLADYEILRGWTGKGARIGVIGGGFIGSEIAAALASNGEQVVMAFPDSGIGARVYPADLVKFVSDYYCQKGVEIHHGTEIQAITRRDQGFAMQAKTGQVIEVDHIIAGIGIRPNTELAQAAGIEIAGNEGGNGILVDEYLRTNQPDIYAAGDVASFYNPALGRTTRVEHEDNANMMGRIAGFNIAGRPTSYNYLPYFYSDMFDLGYEAVGELDPRLDIYSDWVEPFRKGVIYYLRDRKVRGVLLWNTWDQVGAARRLIEGGRPFDKTELKDLLPEK